jgi:hypothetical protein
MPVSLGAVRFAAPHPVTVPHSSCSSGLVTREENDLWLPAHQPEQNGSDQSLFFFHFMME